MKSLFPRKLNPNDGHRYLPYIVLVIDEFSRPYNDKQEKK